MEKTNGNMKLTGLNIDCLECVFDYLELIDLISVASSNKRLGKVANLVFARQHSKRCFQFQNQRLYPDPRLYGVSYMINDLKTSLKLLRCFGHLIFRLEFIQNKIITPENTEIAYHMLNYINKYCANSLQNILIDNAQISVLERIEEPFTKVFNLYYTNCNVFAQDSFNRLFPNMTNLYAVFQHNDEPMTHQYGQRINHFPRLKALGILNNYSPMVPNIENTSSILRSNPQLTSLMIRNYDQYNLLLDSDVFRNALKCLQNLEKFIFHVDALSTDLNDDIIQLNNLNDFTLFLEAPKTNEIPFLFPKLETLTLQCAHVSDGCYQFIGKHPKILDLTIVNFTSNFNVDLVKLAKSLPLLVKFQLSGFGVTFTEAIRFIKSCPYLKQFICKLNTDENEHEHINIEHFKEHIGNKWDGLCRRTYIHLYRSLKLPVFRSPSN